MVRNLPGSGTSPGLRGPLTGPPRFSDLFGSVFVDYGSGACRLLSLRHLPLRRLFVVAGVI